MIAKKRTSQHFGNYLAVVTSQYFLFKNLIKGYHKSLVFLRI